MGVLTVSVVASTILFALFFTTNRSLRTLQAQANFIYNRKAQFNMFVGEIMEYSKKNPAVDPLLESIGAKAPRNPPAAATPAAATPSKPAAK
jgi:hypothetical protein